MSALEICAEDSAGVRAAVAGGADRIELCAGLAIGGLTPSPGAIRSAVASGCPVVVLVRPRCGDFVHDEDELRQIEQDITVAAQQGAAGVAIGVLRRDGGLDHDANARLIARAQAAFTQPPLLTLHRACDLVPDADALVDGAVALGFDRVLTSGGAPRALDGADRIARMVRRAGGRIAIMAGGGVNPDTAAAILARTGVVELHASARSPHPVDARLVALGFADPHGLRTDPQQVATIAALLRAAQADKTITIPIADDRSVS